ncbi:MAG: hypothetical protein CMI53_04905 [Parcubacteria group bacterium]|nr:hypothetical protein [Parcubacteria group bacterium]
MFTVFVFGFIKFYLKFPDVNSDALGTVITVSSILFGFLAGFFINELWSRYTEIRSIQGARLSDSLNMINYAENFYGNIKFKNDFKRRIEATAFVDEIINWDEGQLETSYWQNIERSFDFIKDERLKEVNQKYTLMTCLVCTTEL